MHVACLDITSKYIAAWLRAPSYLQHWMYKEPSFTRYIVPAGQLIYVHCIAMPSKASVWNAVAISSALMLC